MNKPDTLNSLTVVMAGDFAAALQQLQADTAARALVITGPEAGITGCCCAICVLSQLCVTVLAVAASAHTAPDCTMIVRLTTCLPLTCLCGCCWRRTGVGQRAFSAGGDFDFIQQRMDSGTAEESAKVIVTH